MRWLCGCLGQTGTETSVPVSKLAEACESDAVVVRQGRLPSSSELHNSDVQDKDQAHAPGSTPPRACPHRLANQVLTWSPGQVSLDIYSLSGRQPSISDLQKQERTWRALLDRVNKFGNHAPTAANSRDSITNANSTGQLKIYDPEVSRINQLILKCTSTRPGTEAYERATQLLQDLRSWLLASTQQGPGLVLLCGAGEALMHCEDLARSAGQVRFWSAPVVQQLVALLQVYAALMDCCMAPAAARPPGAGEQPAAPWRTLLTGTLVKLLVRVELLQLLVEALELVQLNAEFEAKSQRQEASAAAVCVLDFMRGLARFAAAQLEVDDKSLTQCLQVLADLLSPSRGLLPRVLQRPLLADNMTVQLHALQLLQQLYDSPPAALQQLLRAPPVAAPAAASAARPPPAPDADDGAVAAFYLQHHLTGASHCYFSSGGDPASGFAEMCMLHVQLVRSLSRGAALPPASGPGPRLQLNELLLSELAEEYVTSQAAAAAAAAARPRSPPTRASDGDDSDEVSGSDASPEAAAKAGGSAAAAPGADAAALAEGRFEFTYDLNEDLARILELEEKLGEAVEVNGFEYDNEGRQLLERSAVMAAAAEAGFGPRGSGRPAAVSEGGRPAVPKLSFSSFSRSALSSSRSAASAPPPPPSSRSRTLPAALDAAAAPAVSSRGPSSHRQPAQPLAAPPGSPPRLPTGSARAWSRRSSSPPTRACPSTPLDAPPAAAAPPRAPSPAIPMLDLSGLGLGSSGGRSLANTRRSGSTMNTAHGSSSGGGALPSIGTTGGRRRVTDIATDTGCKADTKRDSCQAAATTRSPDPAGDLDVAAPNDLSCSRGLEPGPGPSPGGGGGLLFRAPQLHELLLGSALEASVTPAGGLDPALWPQYPLDSGLRHNLEYLLIWHLNAGAGAAAVPELQRRLLGGGGRAAAARARLLRLLARQLFDSSRYSELKFLARGAFSTVFRAKALAPPGGQQQQVIIKSVPLPASCYDRCVLPDVYSEVTIMEQYKGCPGICQLLDYGLTDEAFWIVMRRYRCSLAEWRQRQSLGPANAAAAALYLSILLQVVAALKLLARDSVVHFDLKCSNVLIDPRPGTKDSELWSPLGPAAAATAGQPPAAPFQAVLADFGEARSYRSAGEAFTVRIRGTEVYKSPEMLLMNQRPAAPVLAAGGGGGGSAAAAHARAALQGAGLASDVWSLGCLAFELLSGKVLFGGDYASVTHRVAFGGRGNLNLDAAERAALGDRPRLVALIEWVLARDPAQRPSLEEIEARVREVQGEVWAGVAPSQLSMAKADAPPAASGSGSPP